ncbi:MAG: low temperature requirement protein A [Geminicoccaceae bacterium]
MLAIQVLYMWPKVGTIYHDRFLPRLGHIAERMALLVLIVTGEGFFKLVVTLSEKGVYKVGADVLVNFAVGGASLFALAWIYFDFVGNAKPRFEMVGDRYRTAIGWWLSHIALMLSCVMIGVALAGEVKVGFFEPYPLKYAVFGCIGLALFIGSMLMIQNSVEERPAHRFAPTWVRILGIVISLGTLALVPFVPSWVGNIAWGSALLSQVVLPLAWSYRELKAGRP